MTYLLICLVGREAELLLPMEALADSQFHGLDRIHLHELSVKIVVELPGIDNFDGVCNAQ